MLHSIERQPNFVPSPEGKGGKIVGPGPSTTLVELVEDKALEGATANVDESEENHPVTPDPKEDATTLLVTGKQQQYKPVPSQQPNTQVIRGDAIEALLVVSQFVCFCDEKFRNDNNELCEKIRNKRKPVAHPSLDEIRRYPDEKFERHLIILFTDGTLTQDEFQCLRNNWKKQRDNFHVYDAMIFVYHFLTNCTVEFKNEAKVLLEKFKKLKKGIPSHPDFKKSKIMSATNKEVNAHLSILLEKNILSEDWAQRLKNYWEGQCALSDAVSFFYSFLTCNEYIKKNNESLLLRLKAKAKGLPLAPVIEKSEIIKFPDEKFNDYLKVMQNDNSLREDETDRLNNYWRELKRSKE